MLEKMLQSKNKSGQENNDSSKKNKQTPRESIIGMELFFFWPASSWPKYFSSPKYDSLRGYFSVAEKMGSILTFSPIFAAIISVFCFKNYLRQGLGWDR